MKTKFFSLVCALLLGAAFTSVSAQSDNGVKMGLFNHLSVGVSASTLGYGFDIAMPVSPYLTLRGGVDIMPSITFDTDVDVDVDVAGYSNSYSVNIEGDTKRTQTYVLANI